MLALVIGLWDGYAHASRRAVYLLQRVNLSGLLAMGAGTLSVLFGGCAASPEVQARWAAVRFVKDPQVVRSCDLLTIEHDDDFQHFREEAVRRGGNVVLITGRKQYQFPCCMHDVVEIYRCP